ncbi:MAG: glycosylphosphatidylinositol anchor biosynthesis [Trizodia sp. TS-e1964]|nr:MAG: glycosylphosphatidylinositol anchor biosynthesis [Trizodia sp. TS-e1964]
MGAIFALLVAFRLFNALTIKTFFQPDEYFQSLEPAWQLAFGEESGAWITWEWKYQLRSSFHPTIFAVIYYLTSQAASVLSLSPHVRAELLLASPKAAQAVCAAACDYYTWKLAQRIYRNNKTSWVTVRG